jgi:uncharacterized protein YcbK (DUF882 family)
VSWSRRRVLQSGMFAGISVALRPRPSRGAPQSEPRSKRIALLNLHTDERLEIEYFHDAAYAPDALAAIARVLRDFRTGEQHTIDPQLMDYLVDVAASVGAAPDFSVISGYRSPQTNERLHERSRGVALHSLHMQGRAIDVRLPKIDCRDLAACAQGLRRGGVGYYRASDFVHLDTGNFRTWRG